MTKGKVKITGTQKTASKIFARNIHKNENKRITRKRLVHICDLPHENLEKILININIKYWSKFRNTCVRFRNICDAKIRHEFRATLHRLLFTNPDSYEVSVMKLIRDMASVYIRAGFESLFYAACLPLMGKQATLIPPGTKFIKPFLIKFYLRIQHKLGHKQIQKNNLLYILTFISTLKKCKNCNLVNEHSSHFSNWNVIIELNNFWFGLLHSYDPFDINPENRCQYDILAILSQVLLNDNLNKEERLKRDKTYLWDGIKNIFVCGIKTKSERTMAKVLYNMNMYGSKTIIEYVKAFFYNDNRDEIDLKVLPIDDFDLNMKVTCKEAVNWGCRSIYSVNIGSSYPYLN